MDAAPHRSGAQHFPVVPEHDDGPITDDDRVCRRLLKIESAVRDPHAGGSGYDVARNGAFQCRLDESLDQPGLFQSGICGFDVGGASPPERANDRRRNAASIVVSGICTQVARNRLCATIALASQICVQGRRALSRVKNQIPASIVSWHGWKARRHFGQIRNFVVPMPSHPLTVHFCRECRIGRQLSLYLKG